MFLSVVVDLVGLICVLPAESIIFPLPHPTEEPTVPLNPFASVTATDNPILPDIVPWWHDSDPGTLVQKYYTLDPTDFGESINCEIEPMESLRKALNLSDGYSTVQIARQARSALVGWFINKLTDKQLNTTGISALVGLTNDVFWDFTKRRVKTNSTNAIKSTAVIAGAEGLEFGSDALAEFEEHTVNIINSGVTIKSMRSLLSVEQAVNHVNKAAQNAINSIAKVAHNVRNMIKSNTTHILDGLAFAAESVTDAQKVAQFLNSDLTTRILNSVVGDLKVSVGINTTLSLTSPMLNIGQTACDVANKALGSYDNGTDVCTLFAIARAAIACNSRLNSYNCLSQSTAGVRGRTCERYQQEPSQMPPITAGEIREVLDDTQGNVDRWLFNGINILYQYSRFDNQCGKNASDFVFLPGWKTVGQSTLDYSNTISAMERSSMPLSVVLRNECSFVLMIRGTSVGFDWLIDFRSELYEAHVNNRTLGKTHYGFSILARVVVENLMDTLEKNGEGCAKVNVTVTGHSLGAGVAIVATLLLTELLNGHNLSVIAFAPPVSMDSTATAILRNKSRVRAWRNQFDGVPRVPCVIPNGFPRCNEQRTKRDYYDNTPNLYEIEFSNLQEWMPSLNITDFGELSLDFTTGEIYVDSVQTPTPLHVSQMHTCAYACWFDSQYCHNQEWALNMCTTCAEYSI